MESMTISPHFCPNYIPATTQPNQPTQPITYTRELTDLSDDGDDARSDASSEMHDRSEHIFSVFLLHRREGYPTLTTRCTSTIDFNWKPDGPHLFHSQTIAHMYLAEKLAEELIITEGDMHRLVPRKQHTYWKRHKKMYRIRTKFKYNLACMQTLIRSLPNIPSSLVYWECKLACVKDAKNDAES